MKDAARTRAVAAQENRAPATPRKISSIILLISGDGAPKTARDYAHHHRLRSAICSSPNAWKTPLPRCTQLPLAKNVGTPSRNAFLR